MPLLGVARLVGRRDGRVVSLVVLARVGGVAASCASGPRSVLPESRLGLAVGRRDLGLGLKSEARRDLRIAAGTEALGAEVDTRSRRGALRPLCWCTSPPAVGGGSPARAGRAVRHQVVLLELARRSGWRLLRTRSAACLAACARTRPRRARFSTASACSPTPMAEHVVRALPHQVVRLVGVDAARDVGADGEHDQRADSHDLAALRQRGVELVEAGHDGAVQVARRVARREALERGHGHGRRCRAATPRSARASAPPSNANTVTRFARGDLLHEVQRGLGRQRARLGRVGGAHVDQQARRGARRPGCDRAA